MEVAPTDVVDIPENLADLSRRELQQLAKRLCVRANQKSVEMIAQIEGLRKSSYHLGDGVQSEGGRRPAVATAASPPAAETPTPEAILQPTSGALHLIQRSLPPMLTPARCTAGRWQPLRLVGDSVELTMLVREAATLVGVDEVLELPPLKLGRERLTNLKVI